MTAWHGSPDPLTLNLDPLNCLNLDILNFQHFKSLSVLPYFPLPFETVELSSAAPAIFGARPAGLPRRNATCRSEKKAKTLTGTTVYRMYLCMYDSIYHDYVHIACISLCAKALERTQSKFGSSRTTTIQSANFLYLHTTPLVAKVLHIRTSCFQLQNF